MRRAVSPASAACSTVSDEFVSVQMITSLIIEQRSQTAVCEVRWWLVFGWGEVCRLLCSVTIILNTPLGVGHNIELEICMAIDCDPGGRVVRAIGRSERHDGSSG